MKPGLYKSAILPILVYGLQCVALKTDLAVFGKFQKRCVKWRAGVQTGYEIQFILLSLLPLPIYLQLNEILLLNKLTSEVLRDPKLPERETKSGRAQELLKSMKTRTKKARREFMFRTARIVKGVENQIDFTKLIGLRKRVLKIM